MSSVIINEKALNNHYELNNARIIQEGMLPKKRHFDRLFKEHFSIYLPKNVISGDFYWIGKKNNLEYIVVGDCTGHGISAALLSILAINLFEYSIMNKGFKKTNKILKEVDKKFIESFKNNDTTNFDNPWIDLSLVCIDKSKKEIYYSSANRKIVLVDSLKKVNVYNGSRYPIGGWQLEKNRTFSSQTIKYNSGDQLYLGSDGFQDQIGGEHNKKFKSKKLHEVLGRIADLDVDNRKEMLEETFLNWKGQNEQTDDVCLVGITL